MEYGIYDTIKSYKNLKRRKTNLKLIIFSILTGILVGVIVSLYTIFLSKIIYLRNIILSINNDIKIPFIILIFIIFSLIIQKTLNLYPLISGSGIPQVVALIQGKIKFNYLYELIFKFLSGLLSIFIGLSLGREGPSIHLGALIGDGINKISKRSEVEKKYLLTAGASAGLAAAFNAPLSGAIFAIEELHRFFSPILLICVLISSLFSNLVSKLILGTKLSFENYIFISPINYNLGSIILHFLLIIILSFLLTIIGKLFNYSIIKFKNIYEKFLISKYIKLLIFSFLSLTVILFFPEITGGGHELIEELLYNSFSFNFLFILLIGKFIWTMLSYSTGAPGGIFLPLLVISALIGKLYGIILVNFFNLSNDYITLFVLISMTSFFTSVVRSPITGIVLILEMSGNFSNLFSLVIAAAISYTISELFKMNSIYEILFKKMFHNDEPINNLKLSRDIITLKIPVIADSKISNMMIKDINLPKNLLIIGIERDDIQFIPNGETILKDSDILIFLTDKYTSKKYANLIYEMALNAIIK